MRYTPPELLAGLTDDDPFLFKTADMFGLGAVLFELFAEVPLGLIVYERGFVTSFMSTMAVILPRDRRRVFDGAIGSIADARPLPSVGISGRVPGSIRLLVDGLVKDMAALDYRKRPGDFASTFRRIEICLIVLRHEERQRRRTELRRRIAQAEKRAI